MSFTTTPCTLCFLTLYPICAELLKHQPPQTIIPGYRSLLNPIKPAAKAATTLTAILPAPDLSELRDTFESAIEVLLLELSAVAETESVTAVALGTPDVPLVISNTLEAVELNTVCAIDISLLDRS